MSERAEPQADLREALIAEMLVSGDCYYLKTCRENWPTDPKSWCQGCLLREATQALQHLAAPVALPEEPPVVSCGHGGGDLCPTCVGVLVRDYHAMRARLAQSREQVLHDAMRAVVAACGVCDGHGYTIETGTGDDHACGGDERLCQSMCPVPVPIEVQEACEYCGRPCEAIAALLTADPSQLTASRVATPVLICGHDGERLQYVREQHGTERLYGCGLCGVHIAVQISEPTQAERERVHHLLADAAADALRAYAEHKAGCPIRPREDGAELMAVITYDRGAQMISYSREFVCNCGLASILADPPATDERTAPVSSERTAVKFLAKLLKQGSWYLSAIELDDWNQGPNGEQLKAEAQKIVDESR